MSRFYFLLLCFLPLSSYTQDCLNLPDSLFVCGFTTPLPVSDVPGTWSYLCQDSNGVVAMDALPNDSTQVTVNQCGLYFFEYSAIATDCNELDTIEIYFDDPSSVNTQVSIVMNSSYPSCPGGGGYYCTPGGGPATVSIFLPEPITELDWSFGESIASSSALNYLTEVVNISADECAADEIIVTTESCVDSLNQLQELGYSEEYILEHFFEIYDSLVNALGSNLLCDLINPGCNSYCVDTIDIENDPSWVPFYYDTTQVIIPHIVPGGGWGVVLNGSFTALQDTSIVTANSTNYRIIVEPGADFNGPGVINFTLDEAYITVNDTTYYEPTFGNITLYFQWRDNFEYDTLTQIRTIYNSPTVCQGCGGYFSSSFLEGPNLPPPCPPIPITWEFDYCACNPIYIDAVVENSINCAIPCTSIDFVPYTEWGFSDGQAYIDGPEGSIMHDVNTSYFACTPGFYSVVYYDYMGCEAYTNFEIMADYQEFSSSFTTEICEGSCYEWNGVPYCEAGFHEQIFTAFQNGCDSVVTLNLLVIPTITEFETHEICAGSTYNGYSAGHYIIEQNTSSCLSFLDLTIIETAIQTIETSVTLCQGECTDWNNQTYCDQGVYTFMSMQNGCEVSEILTLSIDFATSTPINVEGVLDCENSVVTLSVFDEGLEYIWSNGATGSSIQVSEAGNYSLTVLTENGCSFVETALVTQNSEEIIVEETYFICSGECVPDALGNPLCEPGIYSNIVDTGDNCPVNYIFNIAIIEASISYAGTLPNLDCENPTVYLTDFVLTNQNTIFHSFLLQYPNGTSVSFEENLPSILLDMEGLYQIIAYYTSSLGTECETVFDFEILSNVEMLEIEVGGNLILDCITGISLPEIIGTVEENYIYTWEGPAITADNMNAPIPTLDAAGLYSITLVNPENGCNTITEFIVSEPLPITFTTSTTKSCGSEDNGSLSITAVQNGNAPFLYSLDNENWQTENDFSGLGVGVYTVRVQDNTGCEAELLKNIEGVNEIPDIEITEFTICGEENISISAALENEGIYNYLWLNGAESSNLEVSKEGIYDLQISNECYAEQISFRVQNDLENPANFIYFPNAFSPNGNENNRIFKGYFGKEIIDYSFQIFDRWGNQVFATQNPELGWDGTKKGALVNSGIYVWSMTGKMENCRGEMEAVKQYGDVFMTN